MNGFANHGLDEDAFGEKRGNIVQAFDAFRTSFHSLLLLISIGEQLALPQFYDSISHELTS
jgi:hypothetical protein